MKELIFNILQITLSVLLILVILVQQKGSGLGSAFGGSDNTIFSTKRGVDKVLHNGTIIIAILFFTISLVRLIL
jgi:protein translocase SecG subunit